MRQGDIVNGVRGSETVLLGVDFWLQWDRPAICSSSLLLPVVFLKLSASLCHDSYLVTASQSITLTVSSSGHRAYYIY